LGELYLTTGSYTRAEDLFRKAVALAERRGAPEELVLTLNILTTLLIYTERYADAETMNTRTRTIAEQALGADDTMTGTSINNRRILYEPHGDFAAAEPWAKRALAIYENAEGPDNKEATLFRQIVAKLAWAQGKWSEAAAAFGRGAQARDNIARAILSLGDETRKLGYAVTFLYETNRLIAFSVAAQGKVPTAASLGLEVILRRKGQVLDVMADSLAVVRRSLAPSDRQLFEQWRESTMQYATLVIRHEKMEPATYRSIISQVLERVMSFEAELSERSASFRLQAEAVTPERVQRALPKRAALIEWALYRPYKFKANNDGFEFGTPRYAAFVLKCEGAPTVVDVGDAAMIDTMISDLLGALRSPGSSGIQTLARELDARLFESVRPYLGDAEHILLSPDGALNLLPFGVLMDPQGKYLIERVELTYLTSGRDLLRGSSAKPRQSMVVIADPDFGPIGSGQNSPAEILTYRRSRDMLTATERYPRLSGTAEEATRLQRLFNLKDSQGPHGPCGHRGSN
jgi:hypothetical protein